VASIRVASPQYFSVLRIPFRGGRSFDEADRAGGAPVAVINRAMARAYWADSEPIGQRIWIGKPMGPENAEPAPRLIVGIVDDVREESLTDPPAPTVYVPDAQRVSAGGGVFLLRTRHPPLQTVPGARAAIRAIDPDLPLTQVRALREVVSDSAANWRLRAVLLGGFGGLALVIAAIGVYGVIAYSVARRTQEIGVRLALGARRRDVLGLLLWEGMRTSLAGIAVGLAAAAGLARLMANQVFGVTATDPATFAGVATLLASVVLVACYIPARRAMRVDPLAALRCD
jgi:predicted permease